MVMKSNWQSKEDIGLKMICHRKFSRSIYDFIGGMFSAIKYHIGFVSHYFLHYIVYCLRDKWRTSFLNLFLMYGIIECYLLDLTYFRLSFGRIWPLTLISLSSLHLSLYLATLVASVHDWNPVSFQLFVSKFVCLFVFFYISFSFTVGCPWIGYLCISGHVHQLLSVHMYNLFGVLMSVAHQVLMLYCCGLVDFK